MTSKIGTTDSKKLQQSLRRPPAQRGRTTGTRSRGTESRSQAKHAAGTWITSRRSMGRRLADVTAGRFRHGTAGVSAPEAENPPAGPTRWTRRSPSA